MAMRTFHGLARAALAHRPQALANEHSARPKGKPYYTGRKDLPIMSMSRSISGILHLYLYKESRTLMPVIPEASKLHTM